MCDLICLDKIIWMDVEALYTPWSCTATFRWFWMWLTTLPNPLGL